MHSSVIKLVVDQVSDILASDDPFLSNPNTMRKCNDLLQFLANQAAKSPTFACAIWHYLLDHGYQIGNCCRHEEFAEKFSKTLETITPDKRSMLRKISDKMFAATANPIRA